MIFVSGFLSSVPALRPVILFFIFQSITSFELAVLSWIGGCSGTCNSFFYFRSIPFRELVLFYLALDSFWICLLIASRPGLFYSSFISISRIRFASRNSLAAWSDNWLVLAPLSDPSRAGIFFLLC